MQAYNGSYLLGDGFLVSPNEIDALMDQGGDALTVVPYISGDEVYSMIEIRAVRRVINFWDWPLDTVAKQYPLILERLRQTVKPIRDNDNKERRRKYWWLHAENQPGLYHRIGLGDRFAKHPSWWTPAFTRLHSVIVKAKSSNTWEFVLIDSNAIFDQSLVIFASEDLSLYAALQSTFHRLWSEVTSTGAKSKEARQQGGAPLSYNASRSFETFPFPNFSADLAQAGEEYMRIREEIREATGTTLTQFHHNLHDESSTESRIAPAREALANIDLVMRDSYGWRDLEIRHGFHDERLGRKFGISGEIRTNVLARLAKLNQQYFDVDFDEQESISTKSRSNTSGDPNQLQLIGSPSTDQTGEI